VIIVDSHQLEEIGRYIIEGSSDCVKILDLDGRVAYINQAGVEVMELCGAGEVIGRTWIDLWEDDHRAAARDAVLRATAGERTAFEGYCRTAGGVGTWWDVTVTPITDAAGTVVKLLAVSRDITVRRREAAFRSGHHQVLEMIASGAPLDAVLSHLVQLAEQQSEGMLGSVLLLDDDGVHIRHGAAPRLPKAFIQAVDGLPIGPRHGSCGTAMYTGKLVIAIDVLTDPVWEDYKDLAVAHGLRACWSAPILTAQKKVLGSFAMYYAQPRGPDRDDLRLIEIAADIAGIAIDHQRAQEALRRSEARNRAILKAIPDWMFILNRDGVFLDYHAKDPTYLLAPPEVFLGKAMRDILPPALAGELHQASTRSFETGEPERVEYSIGSDEAQRFYEACVVRCDDDKMLSIVRDITDRKRAEMDAARQRRDLAHLSRVTTLGELSGALAHELSQPLTAILSNAQAARRFLSQEPVDLTEVRAALDDIIANDRRAGAVIERLRVLLKKGESLLQPLDLNDVAREVLDLTHSDLLARRISISTRLASPLPPVLGDRVQLQQVVLNLMLNACEAMNDTSDGDRRITLETGVDNGFVQMSLSDRGVGIPEHQLEAVFEPFVTFREQGLGLGLAISRSIIVAHGGRILAENNADRGSTFRCFLPVTPA
jgi:PAS domain S-box-containing protein